MKTLYKLFASAAAMFFAVNATAQLSAPIDFPLPPNISAANVSAAEWYFDKDPGLGNGTNIPVTAGNNITVNNSSIAIDTLSTGVHRIYVRVKNTNGNWSVTNAATFFIIPQGVLFPANAGAANVSAAEYFLDNDPGLGNGTSIPITAGPDVSADNIAVPIDTLSNGAHRIYVRVKNANGNWSVSNVAAFYIVPVSFSIPSNAAAGNITALEYFFDHDPGFGNGTMISITSTTDVSNYQITADISGLQQDTAHTLYVRALDGWSQTNSTTFRIGIATPVTWLSFTGKMQANRTVLLQWQTATEQNSSYFSIEKSSDGHNFAPVGKVAAAGNSSNARSYSFTDMQPLQEDAYYRIKEVDADGKFAYSPVLQINTVGKEGFYIINNPARNELRVHTGSGQGIAQIQLFDMNGRLMMHVPVTTNDIQQIDISRLLPGVYILRCSGTDKPVSAKFIKQ